MSAFELATTFLALDGRDGVARLPVGPDFRRTIGQNPAARGTLVTLTENNTDWAHWEIHPKGDEALFALSGEVVMVLETAEGETRATMKAGDGLVVPAGVWHRAEVRNAGRMLFITYGEGTQHRALRA
jgi:mannose-6-phosphate isomerase-like protein (cupin superfamily)